MNLFKTSIRKPSMARTKTSKSKSIYDHDFRIDKLNGQPLDLTQLKGRFVLLVNVASKCGFTPQYKALQELYDTYSDKLEIIGVPCNQFGNQEPGSTDEISNFCQLNYGVSFTMTEKMDVKGKNQHPLFYWLTNAEMNGKKSSTVKWNFQKYLIDPEGRLIDYFYSMTSPLSKKITKHLNQ
ncbi:MAG: glutathione peroxidase [Flavobacteriaceae bacterium]|nr:glutathione peroxidase [Flavobacteriaceae bacterium]